MNNERKGEQSSMAMDDRKQRVLQAIVTLYGADGEPVGSGLLASYFDMAVSSATLRNEMAALTKLGLLEQPHTSAGRVPSAKGYRYYLDHLLEGPEATTLEDIDRIRIDELFATMDVEPEKLAPAAARALADYTGCAAAATTPRADDLCIAHFEVVQVGRYSAAILAVTSAGGVRTRVARVDTGLSRSDAAALAQLLNRGLTFVSPEDLTQDEEARQNLGTLLEVFSDNRAATELLQPEGGRITAKLGEDLDPEMPGLCIVCKRYLAGGGLTGTMAVIGSSRMPFRKLIPILDYFTGKLGQSMSGKRQEDQE